jgi:diguanylate cyclase (GGDEF)-like protein
MDERINRIASGEDKLPSSIGIIYADLNGLKTVNDMKGHDTGDKLLFRAAALLKITFEDYEIYRAGGDEFVIVFVQQSEAIVARTLEKLKSSVTRSGYSISAGYAMVTDNESVEAALRESDQNMYKEKAAYYQQKGMDRRKRI